MDDESATTMTITTMESLVFRSERRFSSTVVEEKSRRMIVVKKERWRWGWKRRIMRTRRESGSEAIVRGVEACLRCDN